MFDLIVSENQTIILEDLNVRGMLKNRRLAKSVADVSFYEFVRHSFLDIFCPIPRILLR